MGSTRYDMRAVDLVEVDETDLQPSRGVLGGTPRPEELGDPDDAGRSRAARPRRGRGATRRVPRRWLAAAVAVVALVVGGQGVVSERREVARLAVVGALPGVLDPIDGPMTEVWRSDHRLWSPLSAVGGLVVGVSDSWDGSRDIAVVGLDVDTGEQRWARTVVRSATSPVGGVRCVVPDAPDGGAETDRVVVCLSIDELGPSPQDMSELQPRRSRLLLLAAGTGDLLEERPVDPSTSVAVLGPDLVVKSVTADNRVRVARTGPDARDERWSFTGPPSDLTPEFSFVRTDDDLVVVPGEAGWVLTPDGDVVHAWEPQRPAAAGWAGVVRGRALVQPLRDVLGVTRVVDLRSGGSFETDGFPLTPTVDDGSTGELVLVQSASGDGLLAQDVASGRVRWSVQGSDEGGLLVLDGRVLRADEDELRAVDATTGEQVWSSPGQRTRHFGLHSDGRVVVRTERDADLGTVLVGRGLDDGRVRWTSDVADDIERLVELDGRLYGLTEEAMVAFGDSDSDSDSDGGDGGRVRAAGAEGAG